MPTSRGRNATKSKGPRSVRARETQPAWHPSGRAGSSRRPQPRRGAPDVAARRTASTVRRSRTRSRAGTVAPLPIIHPGLVAHVEFASTDVAATQDFFEAAFGWEFRRIKRPDGPYDLFQAPLRTGGGIRSCEEGEHPKAVPFVEMPDLEEARRTVEEAGGRVLVPRIDLPEAQGCYFLCEVPGGCTVGVWAPK